MCTVLLPPGDNPTALNKYIKTDQTSVRFCFFNNRRWKGRKNPCFVAMHLKGFKSRLFRDVTQHRLLSWTTYLYHIQGSSKWNRNVFLTHRYYQSTPHQIPKGQMCQPVRYITKKYRYQGSISLEVFRQFLRRSQIWERTFHCSNEHQYVRLPLRRKKSDFTG
jgi:hypothetical protein